MILDDRIAVSPCIEMSVWLGWARRAALTRDLDQGRKQWGGPAALCDAHAPAQQGSQSGDNPEDCQAP